MTEKQHPPVVEPTDEKPAVISHIDDRSEIGAEKHASAAADYTGAERKSDPEEIALVRKIDWRLMVRSFPFTLVYNCLCWACCTNAKAEENENGLLIGNANSQP